jgi:hypothetical protein
MVSNWSAISWWVIVQLYHGEHMLHSMWWCPLCTETTTLKIDFWNVTQTCLPTRTHYPNANPSFLLLLNIAYLAKKQQIPILQSSIWPDWFSIIIMYDRITSWRWEITNLERNVLFKILLLICKRRNPQYVSFWLAEISSIFMSETCRL